jgi:nicotinate-nucleotide adenylyltransferase
MRTGILGGSFDPVHLGHLWIGEAASEQLSLDRLLWIPTATQPLKPEGPVATDQQRLDMLRLAIAGREGHEVDSRELVREGRSYTVDTVNDLISECPEDDFFLIIGSDSLASMQKWHRPDELLSKVTLAVVRRAGDPPVDFDVLRGIVDEKRIHRFRDFVIEMPLIELSSSELRRRAEQGRSFRHRVPHAVEAYIEANEIYRQRT